MHLDITPVNNPDNGFRSDGLLAALFEELDTDRELIGVFASADLAKQHALDYETMYARQDEDFEDEVELTWNTGANGVGDVVEYTTYDMSYTGAQYFVEPVHLNPVPTLA